MKNERRYDIDWIRVLVFDILIIYHVGMFFVPWGWHVKNDEIIEWMQWPMSFVSQWRLPILFVVSGMGTRFAFKNKTGKNYIKERFTRLLIPLVVGILLIVAPQVYIERLSDGSFTGTFIEFYPHFFEGIYPKGNFSWHHLWFLPYLLVMSLIATPLFLYLKKENNFFIKKIKKAIIYNPFSLFIFTIPLFVIQWYLSPLYPMTHALVGDWYALSFFFVLFLTGYVLISLGDSLWVALKKIKVYALVIGLIAFPLMVWMWYNPIHYALTMVVKIINIWAWILAIFGFCSTFLNKESSTIKYRNQAVYPFYILHQTITVIIGYWLMDNSMHYLWKFIILVIGAFGFSWLIYEFIIRRIRFIRPLFGVKNP